MRGLAAATSNLAGMAGSPPNNFFASPAEKIPCSEEGVGASDLERVQELRQNLLERQTVYSYCASYYGKRYYMLTIPSIVVTTAISVLAAVWPYDNEEVEFAGRVILSLLGALATILTAVLALFRFQSKMDIFYNAAQQIDGMVSRLGFLTKYRMGERITRNELQGIISGIEDKLNEVRTKVPPIPNDLYVAGCREEDDLMEIRNKREQTHVRKQGWTEGSQAAAAPAAAIAVTAVSVHAWPMATVVYPDAPGEAAAPDSPKEEAPKKQWC